MSGDELTLLDDRLLQLAANGKSANEISEELSISPEKAVLRIREILGSRDIWSDLEREKLLMHSIYGIKEKLESNINTVTWDDKLLKQYLTLLDLLGKRLEARTKINEADLEKVSRAQGLRLIKLVEMGYYKARGLLAEQYPEVDLVAIDAAMSDGLEEAALELESKDK